MADVHVNNINTLKGWAAKWTPAEDEIIRKYYKSNGASTVHKYLPSRSLSAIHGRAHKLKIKYLSYDVDYFKNIDTPTKAYWLGFLYADGYVTSNNRWGLQLAYVDLDHIKLLLKEIKYTGKIRERTKDGHKSCSFLINNKSMQSSLIDKGVVPNKTYILEFPSEDKLPKEYYNHFIRGFFDGDGCLSFNFRMRLARNNKFYNVARKEVSIVCMSAPFLKTVQTILSSNGVNLRYEINSRDNLPTLRTSRGEYMRNFLEFIYTDSNSTNRLKRKYDKYLEIKRHL